MNTGMAGTGRLALAGMAALALLFQPAARADLKKALAQANLEKRSALALENAFAALKEAQKAYAAGETDRVKSLIAEIGDSVQLADESLKKSGKEPRKHPTYFKKAEISTRELARKLESFEAGMSYIDRPLMGGLKEDIQRTHDEILEALMKGRK